MHTQGHTHTPTCTHSLFSFLVRFATRDATTPQGVSVCVGEGEAVNRACTAYAKIFKLSQREKEGDRPSVGEKLITFLCGFLLLFS